jgi:hypothetical protein
MSETLSPRTLRTVARIAAEAGRQVRFAMRGGSMLPLLHEPMILDVAPLTRRANVGDVLVFAYGEIQIAHRVIRVGEEHYITNGDAQALARERVPARDVLGRVAAVWENTSPAARRIDRGTYRLRGWCYAHGYPVRWAAARSRGLVRSMLRRLRRAVRPPSAP